MGLEHIAAVIRIKRTRRLTFDTSADRDRGLYRYTLRPRLLCIARYFVRRPVTCGSFLVCLSDIHGQADNKGGKREGEREREKERRRTRERKNKREKGEKRARVASQGLTRIPDWTAPGGEIGNRMKHRYKLNPPNLGGSAATRFTAPENQKQGRAT